MDISDKEIICLTLCTEGLSFRITNEYRSMNSSVRLEFILSVLRDFTEGFKLS